jgi:CRISPR/Cas system endoribonuclease Cas6 (RAMP superfamily)
MNLSNKVPKKELMKEAMKNPELKTKGKLVSNFVKNIQQQKEKLGQDLSDTKETDFYTSCIRFLLNEFKDAGIKAVNVLTQKDDIDKEKIKRADPLRPAILLK